MLMLFLFLGTIVFVLFTIRTITHHLPPLEKNKRDRSFNDDDPIMDDIEKGNREYDEIFNPFFAETYASNINHHYNNYDD